MRLSMLVLAFSVAIHAQSLFESAVSRDEDASNAPGYELNGFVRGVCFAGKPLKGEAVESKARFGELGFKLRTRKGARGDAFAEVRFRRGRELGVAMPEIDIREAYVNAYTGHLDLRVGHQIVVWGRADGFNPTNNVTPQNMLVRSPDEDDRRQGNFLFRAFYHLHPLRIEAIWAPEYSASVLPTHLFPLPQNIRLGGSLYPDARLKNGAYAVKLHVEKSAFDGSVSWYKGYMPLPGIRVSAIEEGETEPVLVVSTTAYKMSVIGADFATTVGSFGLRGEFAWRHPDEDYAMIAHVPNPDVQFVLGGDRAWGDVSFLIQYVGRHVRDFAEESTLPAQDKLIYTTNRMIHSQQHKISHAVFFRPAWTLMQERLTLEFLGLVNVTTEETFLRPKLNYSIADGLSFTVGYDYYSGPAGTLMGNVSDALSSVFVEVKASF